MRPLSTLLLFLPFVALQQDSWQDPWIKLSPNCENEICSLNDNLLVIPESSVFSEDYSTVLAEVYFTSDEQLFVTCQECKNQEEWLLSEHLNVTQEENGVKKARVKMSGRLDYDNPSSPEYLKRRTFIFMMGFDNFGLCVPDLNNCQTISVELKNVVDQPPSFIGDWGNTKFNLPDLIENVDQSGIVTIEGQDNESEKTDLSLTLTSDFAVFSVTRTEGNSWQLNVANLDYDLGRKSYSLELNLERTPDSYDLPTVSTTTLFANVIDTPDQDPLWEMQCGYKELPEEAPEKTQTFFTIKAVDQDTGMNSPIDYTLVEDAGNNHYQWFELEVDVVSGNVTVLNRQRIDREAIQEETQGMLEFHVRATEQDDAKKTSDTTCRVRIRDIDDNEPKFEDANTHSEVAFHAWVREDSPIGIPFEFCREDSFADGTCSQVINPAAYDEDQFDLSYNDFTLTISSENFADTESKFGVTPNRIIGRLNFFVSSQVLDNSLLNYEEQTEVDFTITATPLNPDPEATPTSKPVKIHIIDINDCPPKFTQKKYTVTIEETVTDQELPIGIDSTDDDKSPQFGKPGHIYSIVKDSTLAQNLLIDNTTGVISVGAERLFNFEESQSKTIKVQVHDCRDCSSGSVVSMMAEAEVEINLTNVNDEKPEITNKQDCVIDSLRNDHPEGDEIVKLIGEDRDENDFAMTITKSSDSNIQAHFNLAEDGSLTLVKALNEENAEIEAVDPKFTFTVKIEDNNMNPTGPGKLSNTYDCSIKIVDINSQRPEFIFPIPDDESSRTWINENSQISANLADRNGKLIQIQATDSDVNADNKQVTYKWNTNNKPVYEEYFELHPNHGTIKLLQPLADFPFEPDTDQDHPNMITLQILAEDLGTPKQSNTATLRLKSFKDIEPEFKVEERETRVEINETDMSGLFPTIELPFAFDPNDEDPPSDDWPKQDIYYQIDGPDLFVIDDSLQNTVTLNGTLDVDCDFCPGSYNFRVSASNTPGLPNFDKPASIQAVTVEVLDINDNVPRFVGLPSYFVLESISNCGDCRIEADDRDTVIDQQLDFNIIGANVSDESLNGLGFEIVPFSEVANKIARLSPNFTVSEGMTGFFDLEVQVTDQGGPGIERHTNSTHVKVVVMTAQNNVTFGFDNSENDLCCKKGAVMEIFLKVLGWSFTEKGSEPCECSTRTQASSPRADSFSQFEGYFVDPDTFEPKSQREIAARYDLKFETLWVELNHQLNISLDGRQGFRGETSVQGSLVGTSFALMIVGIICAAFVVATAVFLLVAYCIRTKSLERRVKVFAQTIFADFTIEPQFCIL